MRKQSPQKLGTKFAVLRASLGSAFWVIDSGNEDILWPEKKPMKVSLLLMPSSVVCGSGTHAFIGRAARLLSFEKIISVPFFFLFLIFSEPNITKTII